MKDKDAKLLEEAYSDIQAKEMHGMYDKGKRFRFFNGKEWENAEIIKPSDLAKLGVPETDKVLDSLRQIRLGKNYAFYHKNWGKLAFFDTEEEALKAYSNYLHGSMVASSRLD